MEKTIRGVFAGMFQTMSLQRELHVDHIRAGADLGAALTHTTGAIKILGNNKSMSILSRELFVLRRSAVGWRITDDMFNQPAVSTP